MGKKFRFKFIPQQEKPEVMEFLVFRKGKILPIATITKSFYEFNVKMFCDEDIDMLEEISKEFEEKWM